MAKKNADAARYCTGERTRTTDDLAAAKKAQEMDESGKKRSNLSAKDGKNYDHANEYFKEDFNNLSEEAKEQYAKTNHESTDAITQDADGNVIDRTQYKAIQNTKELLQDRYLEGNDKIVVAKDQYDMHKSNLEAMLATTTDPTQKAKIEKALSMLEPGHYTSDEAKSPRSTAAKEQAKNAAGHIIATAGSDALSQALAVLISGAIYEIKDIFTGSTKVSIKTRIQRLFSKVWETLKSSFARGAGFALFEILVGILAQIFKSVFGKIKSLLRQFRSTAKQIYNGVYDYFSGKNKSAEACLRAVLKGIAAGAITVGSFVLEADLEAKLSVFLPGIASYLSMGLTIVIASLATVFAMRGVDLAIDLLMGKYKDVRIEDLPDWLQNMFPKFVIHELEVLELQGKLVDTAQQLKKTVQSIQGDHEQFQTLKSQMEEYQQTTDELLAKNDELLKGLL